MGFHPEICAFGASFGWFILSYFILVFQVSFTIVRTGLGAWPGDWDSFLAVRGPLGHRGSVSTPSPCHDAVTLTVERRGREQTLHRHSLLLTKTWTKIYRTACSGVPSSQIYLKHDANGFWQGSSYPSQGWNQMTPQTLKWAWCFIVLTRDRQHQCPQLWRKVKVEFHVNLGQPGQLLSLTRLGGISAGVGTDYLLDSLPVGNERT